MPMVPLRTSYCGASRGLHTYLSLMHIYPFLVHTSLPSPSSHVSVTGNSVLTPVSMSRIQMCSRIGEQEPWLKSFCLQLL